MTTPGCRPPSPASSQVGVGLPGLQFACCPQMPGASPRAGVCTYRATASVVASGLGLPAEAVEGSCAELASQGTCQMPAARASALVSLEVAGVTLSCP